MLSAQQIRRLGEFGVAVLLVALSLLIGRVAGAALFARQPTSLVAPNASPPEFLLVRNAEGEITPLELASRSRPLAVFALSVDCPYCRQNLPHWRRLLAAMRELEDGPEVLVLSLSSAERTTKYLADNELAVRAMFIDNNELDALGLPGVPGTIAFGPGAAPMRRVIGVLNADEVDSLIAWAEAVSNRR